MELVTALEGWNQKGAVMGSESSDPKMWYRDFRGPGKTDIQAIKACIPSPQAPPRP